MHSHLRFALPMLALPLFLINGCASEPAPRPAVAEVPKAAPPPPPAVPYKGPGVAVSGDLMAACNIVINKTESAPKFAYNDHDLQPEDRAVLDQVAKCVTTGPLKGRSLKLIGRADSRGEVEYNFALGSHRADTVAGYLSQLGVEKAKLVETSRGKLDATGTEESSWAQDRRVDIALL
ncbi:OmpA family protein [Pendulispora rubella]|uniref:OmpA family protein n=1 Tax=Pendulispora rubella TaxID=2741070 RepID=A0ABZ2L5B1_9BACT